MKLTDLYNYTCSSFAVFINYILLLIVCKGAFNNYVEKKRGGGVVGPTTPPPLSFEVGQSNVYKGLRDKGEIVCKISKFVCSRGVGCQTWIKFGPRSC